MNNKSRKHQPKVRLSLSAIKTLVKSPPSSTKTFMWDLEVRGFGVYRNSDGRPVFVYQYRMPGGTSQRVTLGQLGELTFEQARTEASKLAHERRMGIDPVAARRKAMLKVEAETGMVIATYFDAYLERRRLVKPMKEAQIKVFRRDPVAPLGTIRLDRLSTTIVDKFKVDMNARGPSIMRSGLVCLNTLINDAVKRGTLQRTEAHAFDIPKAGKRDHRIPEWQAILLYRAGHDIGDVRGDVIEVLLRMGKRKEEVAELPWSEIDLDKREWRLPKERNKSGRSHLIMLPRQVCAILAKQQPDPRKRVGPVFTLNGTARAEMGSQVKDLLDANLNRRIELAAKPGDPIREVPHYTLHDFRKIPASTMREMPFRYSADLVNSMLLHTNGDGLDDIYILTALVLETGDMLQAWNDHFDNLVASPDDAQDCRTLPTMTPAERERRLAELRTGWPKRADQQRAEDRPKTKKRRRRRSDG